MKKTVDQKGITLLALIITVIVLLILAVVTISAIKNDGIMQHAQNAKNKYMTNKDKEEYTLDYYELYVAGKIGIWLQ